MSSVMMVETTINGKWRLLLPEHRAARPQWGNWNDPATGEAMFGWEVERLDSMCKNINPGDVVYDIGTEEGDLSALIASWTYSKSGGGGICLFEPNDRVWPNIKLIWEANQVPDPLASVRGFAGHENNHLKDIPLDEPWPACAFGEVISDHGFCNLAERPDIPSVKLDTFAQVIDVPNVITMDVEGAEFLVLLGAHNLLRDVKPLVYVSIHPQFMQDMYGHTDQDIHEYMTLLGYRPKKLAEDHEEHWVFWNPFGRELVF